MKSVLARFPVQPLHLALVAATAFACASLVFIGVTNAQTCGSEGQYMDWGGPCGLPPGVESGRMDLFASPTHISSGETATLYWEFWGSQTLGASIACSITPDVGQVWNQGGGYSYLSPSVGYSRYGATGTAIVSPAQTTNYTLSCYYPGSPDSGIGQVSATVYVQDVPAPTATITATPQTISAGNSSMLSWSSTNASSCTGTNFSTGGATAGSLSVSPNSTTNYSVSCTGPGGIASAATTLTVSSPALCIIGVTNESYGLAYTYSSGGNYVNGLPITVTWGDGSSNTANAVGPTGGANFTHAWTAPGEYIVTTAGPSYGNAQGGNLSSGTATGNAGSASGRPPVCIARISSGADLTTSAVTPTSATAGSPVTLSATATNIGTLASESFPLLFQVQSPETLKNSSYLSGIAPSGTAAGTVSHTFSSAGTYQVRACSNFNTSWTAIATESNYANNCGPWTQITVAPAANTTLSCTVTDSAVEVGETVTYTVSGGAEPFTWTPSDGVGNYGSADHVNRTFSSSGNYGMTVSKSGYTSGNCPVVAVGPAAGCTNPTASISAAPDRIRPGTSTVLTYSASGITGSCVISGPGVSQTVAANTCVVPSGTIPTPSLTTQSTYTIVCDGVERDRVVINVVPNFEEF